MEMSKTNIESLIQLTAPEPVSSAIARPNALGPAFDDHLRQLQTASPPPEPARQTTAVHVRNGASSSETAKEPTSRTDESNQAPPTTGDDRPERAEPATKPNAGQKPAAADSETAPADEDIADTASPADEESSDTSKDAEAAEAAAAIAAGNVKIVQADEAVGQQVLSADAAEADAESAAQAPSNQNAKQVSSGKLTLTNATGQSADPALVVAVNEQTADAAAAGTEVAEATPEKLAASTNTDATATVETKGVVQHHVVEDGPHRRNTAQVKPDASAGQDGQQDGDGQPPVAAPQDSARTGADKTSSKQRASSATNTTDQAQSSARGATPSPNVSTPNPAIAGAAAAAAGASEVVDRTRSADEAGGTPGQPANQGSGRVDGVLNSLTRFPRSSAASHSGRGGEGQDMPRVDPARFVGRVARAFETAQQRGGTLHLRLSPPELGSMKLELTVKHGVMTASLETETSAARQTLLHHLPALRERLAEQNIRIERFDVDVRQDGGGQSSMGSRQQPQEAASNDGAVRLPHTKTESPEEIPIVAPRIDGTGINLIA